MTPDVGARRACEEEGCKGRTTHGKRFCIEHLRGMPYVQGMPHIEKHERQRRKTNEEAK